MKARIPTVVLFLACQGEAPAPSLERLEDSGASAPLDPWVPDDEAPSGAPLQPTADCGYAGVGEDEAEALRLARCVRLSPEPGEDWLASNDTGDTAGGPPVFSAAPPPPPCGFANLIGAARLGQGAAPLVLYCDADLEGGVRVAQVDVEAGGVRTHRLQEGQCLSELDTGSLVLGASGGRATWAALDVRVDEGEEIDPGLLTVALNAEGAPVGPVERVLFPGTPRAVDQPGPDVGFLLVEDDDQRLYSLPVDEAGAATGEPRALAETVRALSSTPHGDGALVAVGGLAGDIVLLQLGAEGQEEARFAIEASEMAFDGRPSVAAVGSRAVVAWSDGERGFLTWVDLTSGALTVTELGDWAIAPAVVAQADQFYSVDGLGWVRAFSAMGAPLGVGLHPAVAHRAGYLLGLRLQVDDAGLGLLMVGYDIVPMGSGHIYTYHYVEESRIDGGLD